MKGLEFKKDVDRLKFGVISHLRSKVGFVNGGYKPEDEVLERMTQIPFFVDSDGYEQDNPTVMVGVVLDKNGIYPLGQLKALVAPRYDTTDTRYVDISDIDLEVLISVAIDLDAQEAK